MPSAPQIERTSSQARLSAVLCAGLVSACFDVEPPPDAEQSTTNQCTASTDCSQGRCTPGGVCSAESTELEELVLELSPPDTQERFGGARSYFTLRLEKGRLVPNQVTIKYPRTVRGDIALVFGAGDCRPSPVVVSFVPTESHLGLETRRYTTVSEVGTAIVDKRHVDTHRYSLSGIPEGTYDVFLEDAERVDNSQRPECEIAPQSIRVLSITSEEAVSKFLRDLVQDAARTLRVVVPWSSQYEGWKVDVIHPLTAERLSSRAVLTAPPDGATSVSVDLRLSAVMGSDVIGPNHELLRLTPPPGVAAPTITMVLAGLEVFDRGEALVPSLGDLPQPVDYQAWVWRSREGGAVQGRVQFTALSLESVAPGVDASFERRATIGGGGLVKADLPPGRYLARVFPDPQSDLAWQETELTVWSPTNGGGTTQGGHVIVVPEAAQLHGSVRFGRRLPPVGTQVVAQGLPGWPESFLPELDTFALPWASALVEGDRFTLGGLTCRGCEEAAGAAAVYNLFVRPSEKSGLPWIVAVGERVGAPDVEVKDLSLELPYAWTGKLNVESAAGPIPLPRFSVRAFATIGKDGLPVPAADLPRCSSLTSTQLETLPCVARALEVASTRTSTDGSFTLLIPQRVLTPGSMDAGM